MARKKQSAIYKGTNIRLLTDFSAETLQARKEWHDIFKVMKGNNLQPRYSAQHGFQSELKEKEFPRQAKSKSSSPLLGFTGNGKGLLEATRKRLYQAVRKYMKDNDLTGKGKFIVKAVNI